MTDLRKAAEMLMKALDDGWVERGDNVAIAMRQALAQPEQKPVAWRKKANGIWHYFDESTPFPFDDCEPLYEKH